MLKEIKFLKKQQGEELTSLEEDVQKLENELNEKRNLLKKLSTERIYAIQNDSAVTKYETVLRNMMKEYNIMWENYSSLSNMQSGFNLGSIFSKDTFGPKAVHFDLAAKVCKALTKIKHVHVTSNVFFHLDPDTLIPYNIIPDPVKEAKRRHYENANLFFSLLSKPGEDFIKRPHDIEAYQKFYETKHESLNYMLPFNVNSSINEEAEKAIINYVIDFIKKYKKVVLNNLYFIQTNERLELRLRGKLYREKELDHLISTLKEQAV